MSRIEEGDCDDTASFLRGCAFSGNVQRALNGKKGQAVLRELEEALLSMPEKRLAHGVFSRPVLVAGVGGAPTVHEEVCALGALAVHRKVKAGTARAAAVMECANEVTDDPDDGGWEMIHQAANAMRLVTPLAYAIVERNDECGGRTPEETWERMLAWVRKRIRV